MLVHRPESVGSVAQLEDSIFEDTERVLHMRRTPNSRRLPTARSKRGGLPRLDPEPSARPPAIGPRSPLGLQGYSPFQRRPHALTDSGAVRAARSPRSAAKTAVSRRSTSLMESPCGALRSDFFQNDACSLGEGDCNDEGPDRDDQEEKRNRAPVRLEKLVEHRLRGEAECSPDRHRDQARAAGRRAVGGREELGSEMFPRRVSWPSSAKSPPPRRSGSEDRQRCRR